MLLALLLAALPDFTGYVVNQAGILDASSVQQIRSIASQLDHSGVAQIAVLTVTPDTVGDSSIEDFAADVFKKWGLGHDKKRSDGILIVFQPTAKGTLRTKVETGYGLE